MKKLSDEHSDSYYGDAGTGLSDEYASSYYAGLKGMYDQRATNVQNDYSSNYMFQDETGADLIGQAHPKSIVVSDAMGNGGVVENVIERHNHMAGVAGATPTGNYRSKHAWAVSELVKLADRASFEKNSEAVSLITRTIIDIL